MLVIARRYGQLGNRLFLYAHLIAAARHYGVELANPCFAEYANLFPSTRGDLFCRYNDHLKYHSERKSVLYRRPRTVWRMALMHSVQGVAKTLHGVGLRHFPFEVIRLRSGEECDLMGDRFRSAVRSGKTVLVQGWLFRSGQLLHENWSHLRDFFEIDSRDRAAVNSTIDAARSEHDVVVGVHIRRGDYATFQGGRYYFGDEVYARWMNQIREQLAPRRVRFLVCSQEPLRGSHFSGLDITPGPGSALGGSALQDMYSLSEADLIVGPPSTFTAWAAFIGRKPRIELAGNDQEIIVPDAVGAPSAAA